MPIFIKQTRVVSQETRVCFLITRLMNNQIKGRRKGYLPKRRESEDKGAVKSVSQLGCASQDWDAIASQGTKEFSVKPDAESLERNSKSSIVHATSREYPGQERTVAGKNTSQTSSPAKSPRCEI